MLSIKQNPIKLCKKYIYTEVIIKKVFHLFNINIFE